MRITVDTNILVRLVVADDENQNKLALTAMADASLVAISTVSLCELSWVLTRQYAASRTNVANAIRGIVGASNVELNRPAVEAGLAMLDAGGDFADGVIAYEGIWLKSDCFVSFDKKAVKLLAAQGLNTQLLS